MKTEHFQLLKSQKENLDQLSSWYDHFLRFKPVENKKEQSETDKSTRVVDLMISNGRKQPITIFLETADGNGGVSHVSIPASIVSSEEIFDLIMSRVPEKIKDIKNRFNQTLKTYGYTENDYQKAYKIQSLIENLNITRHNYFLEILMGKNNDEELKEKFKTSYINLLNTHRAELQKTFDEI